jgi:hypothetical protein
VKRDAEQAGPEVAWKHPDSGISRLLLLIWLGVWAVTRAFLVARVGFWHAHAPIDFEDVHQFQVWAEAIVETGHLPVEQSWQYPPGAAFLFLVPRLSGGSYGETFVILMLAADLTTLGFLVGAGARQRRFTGAWVWLLGVPLLGTLPVLRFDLVPTAFTVAALALIHRRPTWFGALAGAGAAIKVWPIVVLFGEWNRRRLLRAGLAAAVGLGAVFLVTGILFGNGTSFLGEQGGRGLQVEAVAATPWQLREVVTGTEVPEMLRYGAWEIPSATADTVAKLLDVASLAVILAAALWWLARDASLRRGCKELGNPVIARDFVFAVVLSLVVFSRVLSPQYMLWLLGLASLVLTEPASRMQRPAWVVLGALVLSTSVYGSAPNAVIRNVALVIAAADAALVLLRLMPREPWRRIPGLS